MNASFPISVWASSRIGAVLAGFVLLAVSATGADKWDVPRNEAKDIPLEEVDFSSIVTSEWKYTFSAEGLLDGGKFCVGDIQQIVSPGPPKECGVCFPVVVDLASGRARVARFRGRGGFELLGLSSLNDKEVAIYMLEWGPDRAHSERESAYAWSPGTSSFRRLGGGAPISELSQALTGSQLWIEWPNATRQDWDGSVTLVNRDRGQKIPWQAANNLKRATEYASRLETTRGWNGSPRGYWQGNEQFGPGCGRVDFVSLLRFHPRHAGIELRCLECHDSARVKWTWPQAELEKVTRSSLSSVELVRGAVRPCVDTFLHTRTDNGSFLLRINTDTGTVTIADHWKEAPEAIHQFRDGHVVAIAVLDEKREEWLVVRNYTTGETLVRRRLEFSVLCDINDMPEDGFIPLFFLKGFDAHHGLILSDGGGPRLWILKHPYTGTAEPLPIDSK